MTILNRYTNILAEQNLNFEKSSQIKLESNRGEFYSSPDKSEAHDTIVVNAIALLKTHIRSIGYYIHTGSMRVNIDDWGNLFYYPDLMIIGDREDGNDEYFKRQPLAIVEVTSPETEAFDRGEKFANYRELASLQEYVLISEDRINVECFRKNSEGEWLYFSYSKGEEIELAIIDFRTPIAALYEDVTLLSMPKYNFEQKKLSENYMKLLPPSIMAGESPIQWQLPNQLPVTKLVHEKNLNHQILIGLGTAVMLGFAGSQFYKFSYKLKIEKQNYGVSTELENVIVSSSINEESESKKIFQQDQKEQYSENNFNFQIDRKGESGAKKALGLINRMQKGFFSENQRFASNWEDLGIQIKSQNGEYEYKIISSDRIKTIVTATANKPDLKSYTGVVMMQGESAIDKICQTNENSKKPPVIDEISDKMLECPNGSSSLIVGS